MAAYVEVPQQVDAAARVRANPLSYADHFSQARLFWLNLTPVEKDHVVQAFTFELGKCYEQAIKEREIQVLANVDADLCAAVATGLGMPAPEPTEALDDVEPSPALSQLGQTWPVDGRLVGIVVDPADEHGLDGVREVRQSVLASGIGRCSSGPHGGMLADGLPALRSFLTARSVEFDALLLTGTRRPSRPTRRTAGTRSRVIRPMPGSRR